MTASIRRASFPIALFLAALAGPTAILAGPLGGHEDAPPRTGDRLERMAKELDLTAEQRTQIGTLIEEQRAAVDRLTQETKKQIDLVLNETQRAERDRMLDRRIERRLDRMADSLDLTADQTAQIRTIFKERQGDSDLTRTEMRDRIVAVLTDEQRKEFDETANGRCGRPGGRHGDRGPGPGL